ncbi:MAG TPA: L,D-transpeptidase family protein [Chitinophagales bacterium]|nr:L,D-transpeptidase family protein [Chitinophagales bacterium]
MDRKFVLNLVETIPKMWLKVVLIALLVKCTFLAVNAQTPARNENAFYSTYKLPDNKYIDSIAVHKSAHEMIVFCKGAVLKTYRIHLGSCPVGAKQFLGDRKTPEGLYYINALVPNCLYHKGLSISYPDSMDVARAKKTGKSPGGDIMIHGLPNGKEDVGPDRYQNDWTWGCIAIRNDEIDDIYSHTKVGTPIFITP